MSVNDLIGEQDEVKAHGHTFYLWPKLWQEYVEDSGHIFSWNERKFLDSEASNIPNEPGLYTFVIQPGIANHPLNSYIMYIGKTNRTLRHRFKEYLREMQRETGRPKIVRMLNKYPDNIFFCYTIVQESTSELIDKERALMTAWLPPGNWPRLPARVRRIVGAL